MGEKRDCALMQNGRGDRVDGTIAGQTIRGQYQGLDCVVTFEWQKSDYVYNPQVAK
jgi:hypothetical protein